MKCTNTNRSESRIMAPKEGVYARPQARAVRRRKNERRYVKDGSGRCHVFLVSVVQVNMCRHEVHNTIQGAQSKYRMTYVSISKTRCD